MRTLQEPDSSRHEVNASGEHLVHTSLLIDAPAARVWQVLTDFERMPLWSSSLLRIEGPWQDGAAVVVWQQLMGEVWVQPQVLRLLPGRSLGWSSWWHGDYSRVRDEHVYEVQALAAGLTRLVQRDRFHGPDAPALGAQLARQALKDYDDFNQALRMQAMSDARSRTATHAGPHAGPRMPAELAVPATMPLSSGRPRLG